ncbi:hypothetical protein [Clostridium omnivorum]|uniref:Uncharacterized protein n=1 Tax=Clostridium omnivorum TaxID=1604902 RepID=A0ABQ5N5Z8_9CLOT|nr:hypothetical protein [Clostridium sp. E14]GLC30628.1 hypothetical protein bsdE14_20380 [Clostridium sp. E14]
MKKNTNKTTIDSDKLLSTPTTTGSLGTSESSNLTISSDLVGTDSKDLFIHFDAPKNVERPTQTVDLKPDR